MIPRTSTSVSPRDSMKGLSNTARVFQLYYASTMKGITPPRFVCLVTVFQLSMLEFVDNQMPNAIQT